METYSSLLAAVTAQGGETREVLEVLEKFEVVSAPVNDASDVVQDPHFLERTLVEITGNDVLGKVLMPGPVLHMKSYDGPVYDGVPAVGEHTAEILTAELSLSADELSDLATRGIVSA